MANNDFIDISKFPDPNNINTKADYDAWVNEVLPHAGNLNIDPILSDPGPVNQYDTMPDFFALSAVGDPRFSMGHAMVSAISVYMPRIQLYQEVKTAGGCKVIDNYICNDDGIPIKEVTTVCAKGTPYDLIQPQEVVTFVQDLIQSNIQKDVTAFVNYIKSNYIQQGYTCTIYQFLSIEAFFIIQLKKDNNLVYLKYYYQDINSVSQQLNVGITRFDLTADVTKTTSLMTSGMIAAMSTPIPLYHAQPTQNESGWGYGFAD
jgi:hypothetical protein